MNEERQIHEENKNWLLKQRQVHIWIMKIIHFKHENFSSSSTVTGRDWTIPVISYFICRFKLSQSLHLNIFNIKYRYSYMEVIWTVSIIGAIYSGDMAFIRKRILSGPNKWVLGISLQNSQINLEKLTREQEEK